MANRTAPQPPQQRDMVYCHECEDEWFRHEHGLTCPRCHSEFVEVIEANHDPRDDPLHLPSDQEPGHGEFYGAPDPDEDDIDNLQWHQAGSGQMRTTFNRTFEFGTRQGGQQGQGQEGGVGGGGGLLGALGNMLFGGLDQQGLQPQQQGQQGAGRPQSPEAAQGNRAQSAPGTPRGGGSNVRHFHLPGGGHMTIASTTSTFGSGVGGGLPGPRNANGPQPFNNQPEMIDQMMGQMLANIMGGANGPGAMHGQYHGQPGGMPGGGRGGPFVMGGGPSGLNFLDLLGGPMFGMAGGRMGDAVWSQEELDRVITQLMEQHQTGNAPGPASEAAMKSLPTRELNTSDLDEKTGKAECSICMDEVTPGSTVTVLPCTHWFHGECIKAWLSEHDTCPHCRQGIMPKDNNGEARNAREPSQPPLHDTHGAAYAGPRTMPGGFPPLLNRQESGSQQNPFTVPDGPQLGRRASSTGPSERRPSRQSSASGGGMFSRMRDAFSPSSSRGQGSSSNGGGSGQGDNPGPSLPSAPNPQAEPTGQPMRRRDIIRAAWRQATAPDDGSPGPSRQAAEQIPQTQPPTQPLRRRDTIRAAWRQAIAHNDGTPNPPTPPTPTQSPSQQQRQQQMLQRAALLYLFYEAQQSNNYTTLRSPIWSTELREEERVHRQRELVRRAVTISVGMQRREDGTGVTRLQAFRDTLYLRVAMQNIVEEIERRRQRQREIEQRRLRQQRLGDLGSYEGIRPSTPTPPRVRMARSGTAGIGTSRISTARPGMPDIGTGRVLQRAGSSRVLTPRPSIPGAWEPSN